MSADGPRSHSEQADVATPAAVQQSLPAHRYGQSEPCQATREAAIPSRHHSLESVAMPPQYTGAPHSNGRGRTAPRLPGTQPPLHSAVLPQMTPAGAEVEVTYGTISAPFVVLEHAVPEPSIGDPRLKRNMLTVR